MGPMRQPSHMSIPDARYPLGLVRGPDRDLTIFTSSESVTILD